MKIHLQRSSVIIFLATIFALAFIISPYWMIPTAKPTRLLLLVASITFGGVWAYTSGSEFKIFINKASKIPFVLLFFIFFILNIKHLYSGIPWRGDEDHHIQVALITFGLISGPSSATGILVPALFIAFAYIIWTKPKWAIVIGSFTLIGIITYITIWNPVQDIQAYVFLRYPFVNYWLYTVPLSLASLISHPYHEIIFRIIPFTSVVCIAWITFQNTRGSAPLHRYLWAITIGTIPLINYYASIFYLELPATLLMVYVCFHIPELLIDDFDKVKQNLAWYALIFIGFIKETAIPFLLAFLLCRYAISLFTTIASKTNRENKFITLRKELTLGYSVLFPLFFYTLLRSNLSNSREFIPQIKNLWDSSVYLVLVRSFAEQFGLLLLLFISGIGILLYRKLHKEAALYTLIILGISLLHVIDNRLYVGYSRFNLFIFPPILVGSTILFKTFSKRKPVQFILICLTFTTNIILSPINLDGSKQAYWGNYFTDTSEHYYVPPQVKMEFLASKIRHYPSPQPKL